MKQKAKAYYFVQAIILLTVISVLGYYQINYKTFDEAIHDANLQKDEVYHITENKGHTIVFYGKDDSLGFGIMEKNIFGYRWWTGTGSNHFKDTERILTVAANNLQPRKMKSDLDLVSVSFGVIFDDSIEKIMIKYVEQDFVEASIVKSPKGRIWYCISDKPIGGDPEVKRIYKDGSEVLGWHDF